MQTVEYLLRERQQLWAIDCQVKIRHRFIHCSQLFMSCFLRVQEQVYTHLHQTSVIIFDCTGGSNGDVKVEITT